MSKPTREDVEAIKRYWWNREEIINLTDAYLTQEEELDEVNDRRMELVAMVEQLKIENQALQAEREKDIQEAINEYRGDLRS